VTGEPVVDGRRLRAERTRAAIVEGLLALVEEGDVKPTAPQVAERAQVSLRTVYQHFTELEALFVAMSERLVERVEALVPPVDAGLPLAQRLAAYTHQRCDVLERVTPFARAMLHHAQLSPLVRREANRLAELGRAEVEATFAGELDRLEAAPRALLLTALVTASTWRAWEALRVEQGQPAARAEAVVRFQMAAALAAMGFDPGPAAGADDPPGGR
jgi:TetR/AcrR family transcriptional regulator, regulator of autoinduction and epiphytic fitness